jgi:drug/metabolite transporter (DMT)-like permease
MAWTALAAINIVWGANFPIIKPALETVPPFTFTLLRFVIAMAVLLPLAGRQAVALLRGDHGRRLIAMGLMGMCVAQVAQTAALKLSTASDISLLATTSPLWVALMARLWLRERLSQASVVGFGLGLAGLVLIFWPREGGPMGSRRIAGDAIFLVTGFAWAYYNVMGKEMMARCSPVSATTAAGIAGTLGLVPFAAYEWLTGQPVRVTLLALGAAAYAGLLVTALGFLVLFWALKRVSATKGAALMYLQPLAGVLIAWALLGERLTPTFIAGSALVSLGVGLVMRSSAETAFLSVDDSPPRT